MKFAASLSFAAVMTALASTAEAAEQCRFIEARSEREACYQRQEAARAARQKANETRQAEQQKPYEPMTGDDAARKIHARHLPGLLGAPAYCLISGVFDETWWLTIFHSPASRMITQVIFTTSGSAPSSTEKVAVPATLITSTAACAVLISVN